MTPKLTIQRNDDGTVAAAYLKIREGGIAQTISITSGVLVDLDSDCVILGMEVLRLEIVETRH